MVFQIKREGLACISAPGEYAIQKFEKAANANLFCSCSGIRWDGGTPTPIIYTFDRVNNTNNS